LGRFDTIDFFTDPSLVEDPYPYFEHLRAEGPVVRLPHHGVVAVVGYDEILDVYRDTDTYSSCNSVIGPFAMFPAPLEGSDISETIDRYRDQLPMHDHMVTQDPPMHTRQRALLMKLITPNRLKDNEEFMWHLADRQLEEFVGKGRCEFIAEYSQPFAMLVIADLLGVPEADHEYFRETLFHTKGLGSTEGESMAHSPLEFLYEQFTRYVEDRRRSPQGDVLTGLAQATFPDGSTPEVIDVVRVAANLFAAGQETTVRLIAAALQAIGERPELQQWLRQDRKRLPNFVEEMLRIESPVKGDFRLARVATTVGGVSIPAGATLMVLNGAASRDPSRFEAPDELRPERPNARDHLAFGLGLHSCPGAPLARAEGKVSLHRILDRMADIRVSEKEHGSEGARRYDYAPTFILRGLMRLLLEYTPVG
jgi:cytochrome P450